MSEESCGSGEHETCPIKRTYSIEEAAALLGISRNSAYRSCRAGDMPGLVVIGRRYLVSKAAFDAVLPKSAA